MADIIQVNQKEIKSQLGNLVRKSVEDTLNALLNQKTTRLSRCTSMNGLKRERIQGTATIRGSWQQKQARRTESAEVSFETAIIERYKLSVIKKAIR